MEAQAIDRYVGTSPRKMRLVIDLIRGKSVDYAMDILHFSPKHASKVAEKVLRSAVSNLQNKEEGGRLEPSDIVVKKAYVDVGITMKRISPAPMGRAYRIRKRSNHITIVVAPKEMKEKVAPKPKSARSSEAVPKKTVKSQTKTRKALKKTEAAATT
jgi:large subunit ribosomal protein L22